MVEQHMMREADEIAGLGEHAGLNDRIELIVPDDHLADRQPAPRNHRADRRGCGLMRRCTDEPTILIGVNQVRLCRDGADAIGACAIGEQLSGERKVEDVAQQIAQLVGRGGNQRTKVGGSDAGRVEIMVREPWHLEMADIA